MFTTPGEDVFSGQANDNFELFKAWAGTTLAYAILPFGLSNLFTVSFAQNLLISAIVCGLGFVLHELAHRIVARGYGAEAHFVANNGLLMMSILISLAGIFIAAPGAVWHRGYLTKRQGGLIALAGPVMNMVIALIFFIALMAIGILRLPVPVLVIDICREGLRLNGWLGLFNMIPAGPFDGAKVLNWNPLVFGITVAIGAFLTFVLASDQAILTLLSFFR